MVWNIGKEKEAGCYTYDEALKKIEWLMDNLGIRKYCTKYCKGHCCSGCYEGEDACHKHEGRRIQCSWFICTDLRDVLFTKEQETAYSVVRNEIRNINEDFYKDGEYYHPPKSIKKLKREWKIKKEILDRRLVLNTDKIKKRLYHMNYLGGMVRGAVQKEAAQQCSK